MPVQVRRRSRNGVRERAPPGALPFELQAGRGLRFEVKGQPGITAEFEQDETGAVIRLVAQRLGDIPPQDLTSRLLVLM